MPLVIRNARRDGHSGLTTPVKIGVCIASLVVALTLGVLVWVFIIRRRNKGGSPAPASTKSQPSPATDPEKAQDQTNQVTLSELSSPPAYSPGSMKNSSPSNKRSTPALNVDVDRGGDESTTLPSPLRSASFNPSTKTDSIASRISSRMSAGAKRLPRLMIVAALYVPSLSDELPIRLGETIRMIEEYEDEWCLAQRVGRTEERGVIPRFCLTERQEVIPRAAQRGSIGLFQTSTFRK